MKSYGKLGLLIPEAHDPPRFVEFQEKFVDGLDSVFAGTKNQLLVCNSSGVPQPRTMKGDGTLAEDGTLSVVKPSTGAAAGTEALRALGTTASTACAGNDSRLSDERVPKKESATEEKIADKAITSRKAKLTAGTGNMSGGAVEPPSESFSDLAGTSQTLTVAVKSLLIVTAMFSVSMTKAEGALEGQVSADGTTGARKASFSVSAVEKGFFGATVSCTNTFTLEPGERVLKLRAGKSNTTVKGTVAPEGTGYTYFLVAV